MWVIVETVAEQTELHASPVKGPGSLKHFIIILAASPLEASSGTLNVFLIFKICLLR